MSQVQGDIEVQGIGTTNGKIPFWIRSNKHGSIPLAGASISLLGGIQKEYNLVRDSCAGRKLLDWGMNLRIRGNLGAKNVQLVPIEASLKAKFRLIELRVGRSTDNMGLTGDSSLTSGQFSVSGNSLGIPKVTFELIDYLKLPIFGDFIAFKGSFSQGWLGVLPLRYQKSVRTSYHQKSLYARLGNQNARLHFYSGFNHQAFYGNERQYLGAGFTLSKVNTWKYVFLGKNFGGQKVPTSKVGNHLGTVDLGFQYTFDGYLVRAYRQNFYETGALFRLANLRDGLYGVSIIKSKPTTSLLTLRAILFEYFNTKNQAGETWSKVTYSGDEDYYNSYVYSEGWSYKGRALGNPFLTTRPNIKKGQAMDPFDYFVNNRIHLIHVAGKFSLAKYSSTAKISYSKNFGTYATSATGRSGAEERKVGPGPGGVFSPVSQLSFYFETCKKVSNGCSVGMAFSIDHGNLLDNSEGVIVRLRKEFSFKKSGD